MFGARESLECEFVRKVFRIDVSAPFEVWQHADPCNSGNLLSGVGPSSKAASVSNVLHSFLLRSSKFRTLLER